MMSTDRLLDALEVEFSPDLFSDADDLYTIKSAIMQLDPFDRAVLLLYADTLSMPRVSGYLGISVSTVYHKIVDARRRLSEIMN